MAKIRKMGFVQRFWNWARPMVIVLVVGFSLRSAVADWNDVPTGSMKPTILEGDRVFVNKLAYDLKVPFTTWHLATWGDPQAGDVVICYSPANGVRLVKRVIGTPGDRIQMVNNRLIINGEPLEYGPLDPRITREVTDAVRFRRVFGTEKLGDKVHAVMATPKLPAQRSFEPITVPAGQYFVMGDNRDNSLDSRRFGYVPRDQIVGRTVGVVFSLDREHAYKPRWGRTFHSLP